MPLEPILGEIEMLLQLLGGKRGTLESAKREYGLPAWQNLVRQRLQTMHDETHKLLGLESELDFRKRVEKMAVCEKDCRPVGHYECLINFCPHICHAARRVLGIALPESYTPVPG